MAATTSIIVSARIPIVLFADVIMGLQKMGYASPGGSTSDVIRGVFVLLDKSLGLSKEERCVNVSTAESFLRGGGYSMDQVDNPKRNQALYKALQEESISLEREDKPKGIPWIAAAAAKFREEHPEEDLRNRVQQILFHMTYGNRTIEETEYELRKLELTLEEAVERYDVEDKIKTWLKEQQDATV